MQENRGSAWVRPRVHRKDFCLTHWGMRGAVGTISGI